MKFTKLTIYSKADELLLLALSELGLEGFEIDDNSDLQELIANTDPDLIGEELLRDLKNESDFAPKISTYIIEDAQGRKVLKKSLDFLDARGLKHETASVAEEDWANNWKQYFKPFEVGGLIIKPSWEELNQEINPKNLPALEIDPGSAFGTGQHASTKLCIELLNENVRKNDCVLDLGAGSGVLSAAALIFGAGSVTAGDISENALRVTDETLKRNGFKEYTLFLGDITVDKKLRTSLKNHDLIVANIVADVIIAMSGYFRDFLKSGKGKLIVSGIISKRLTEVKEALIKNNFVITEVRQLEDWNALLCIAD